MCTEPLGISEPLPDGVGGGVGLPHRTEKREHREHLGGSLAAGGPLDLTETDTAGGDGAGLVQAQGVDPGQDLDGGQLLNQDVAPGQGQGGGGEVDRGQEHQALGHHADHAGDAGDGRVAPGTAAPGLGDASAQPQLGPHQHQGHGHDDPADPVQHSVGSGLQLTDDERVPAGLAGQPVGVGVPADRGGAEQSGPGRHRGPGHDLRSAHGTHGPGLAREDRLIDLQAVAGQNLPVCRHLLAGCEPYDVVENDLADGHLGLGPVPDDDGAGGLQHGQTVQGTLGADLRQGSGGGVEHKDETEQRICPVPQCQDEDQCGAEDAVEDREDVGSQNLRGAAGGPLAVLVGLSGADALGDLGGAEPVDRGLRGMRGAHTSHSSESVGGRPSSWRPRPQDAASTRRASARDLRTEAMTVTRTVVMMTLRDTPIDASGMACHSWPPLMKGTSLVCRA